MFLRFFKIIITYYFNENVHQASVWSFFSRLSRFINTYLYRINHKCIVSSYRKLRETSDIVKHFDCLILNWEGIASRQCSSSCLKNLHLSRCILNRLLSQHMCVTKILFFPIISPSIRNSIVMEYIINKNYRRSRVTKNSRLSFFLLSYLRSDVRRDTRLFN